MAKSPDAFRTISEVAEWLDTPAHVLRFWESKFSQVKPVKRAGGRRYYRPSDMELLGGIKRLLHDDGMTIRGVQKMLSERGVRAIAALSQPVDPGQDAVEHEAAPARADSADRSGAAERAGPDAREQSEEPLETDAGFLADAPPLPEATAEVVPFAGRRGPSAEVAAEETPASAPPEDATTAVAPEEAGSVAPEPEADATPDTGSGDDALETAEEVAARGDAPEAPAADLAAAPTEGAGARGEMQIGDAFSEDVAAAEDGLDEDSLDEVAADTADDGDPADAGPRGADPVARSGGARLDGPQGELFPVGAGPVPTFLAASLSERSDGALPPADAAGTEDDPFEPLADPDFEFGTAEDAASAAGTDDPIGEAFDDEIDMPAEEDASEEDASEESLVEGFDAPEIAEADADEEDTALETSGPGDSEAPSRADAPADTAARDALLARAAAMLARIDAPQDIAPGPLAKAARIAALGPAEAARIAPEVERLRAFLDG